MAELIKIQLDSVSGKLINKEVLINNKRIVSINNAEGYISYDDKNLDSKLYTSSDLNAIRTSKSFYSYGKAVSYTVTKINGNITNEQVLINIDDIVMVTPLSVSVSEIVCEKEESYVKYNVTKTVDTILSDVDAISTTDASVLSRISKQENHEKIILYYKVVSGAGPGNIGTVPANGTILLDRFGDSRDAVLSTINGSNKVKEESPLDSSGNIVTSSLDVAGNYTFSSTPVDANVALIYVFKTTNDDWRDFQIANPTTWFDNVLEEADVFPPQVTQAEAEAGTSTEERLWTPERVKQAINALASSVHNNTTGKQGGTTGEYYHLTANQHGEVVDITAVTHAKGKLLVSNGTDWLGLGVGSDEQSLFADSAQSTGLKWDSPAGAARRALQWTFSTTTTDADPGSAKFRFNNVTQSSATFIYIDDLPVSGVDMGTILGSLREGDRVYIQGVSSARHMLFKLTGTPTDGSGYWKIPVVNEVAGTSLQNNSKCGFILFETGAMHKTTLVNETFESGNFTANGWTVANGAEVNKWEVGTATAQAGTNSAYISDDGGTTVSYDQNSASNTHFWKDFTFPAEIDDPYLSFWFKCEGETDFDFMNIFVVPTTTTPTAGVPISTGVKLAATGYSNGNFQDTADWTFVKIWIDPTILAGQTKRIVFSWDNDGSLGTLPPAAVDNIKVTYQI